MGRESQSRGQRNWKKYLMLRDEHFCDIYLMEYTDSSKMKSQWNYRFLPHPDKMTDERSERESTEEQGAP